MAILGFLKNKSEKWEEKREPGYGMPTYNAMKCWHVWSLDTPGRRMYRRRYCYPNYFAALLSLRGNRRKQVYVMQCIGANCTCGITDGERVSHFAPDN